VLLFNLVVIASCFVQDIRHVYYDTLKYSKNKVKVYQFHSS